MKPPSPHSPAQIQAISGVAAPEKIRVVLFINNEFVHAPLPALLKHLVDQINDLESRVSALENP